LPLGAEAAAPAEWARALPRVLRTNYCQCAGTHRIETRCARAPPAWRSLRRLHERSVIRSARRLSEETRPKSVTSAQHSHMARVKAPAVRTIAARPAILRI